MSTTAREVIADCLYELTDKKTGEAALDYIFAALDTNGFVIAPKHEDLEMSKAAWQAAKTGLPMGRVQPPFCNEMSRISEDHDMIIIGYRAMVATLSKTGEPPQ